MAIFVDTASADDLETASRLGFVAGFTTNPILMARETDRPLGHFERLLATSAAGPAFYQPTGDDAVALSDEARAAVRFAPDRVVVKCPATPAGVEAAAALTDDGVRCALTAVYSPAQALVAHEIGCSWAIPYVDRAARQSTGGFAVVDAIASILARLESGTRLLAASLKNADQTAGAVLHGAGDVTAPLDVLRRLPSHPLSEAAEREFTAAARS